MQTELNKPTNESHPNGKPFVSCWAMGDELLRSSVIAIDGKATIEYNMGWGNDTSIEVENPTYMDLYIACDTLIRESGDEHHTFIESIYHVKGTTWQLTTGS